MTSELAPEPVVLCELSDDFPVSFEAAGSWPKGAGLPATHSSARAPDVPEPPSHQLSHPGETGTHLLVELG